MGSIHRNKLKQINLLTASMVRALFVHGDDASEHICLIFLLFVRAENSPAPLSLWITEIFRSLSSMTLSRAFDVFKAVLFFNGTVNSSFVATSINQGLKKRIRSIFNHILELFFIQFSLLNVLKNYCIS